MYNLSKFAERLEELMFDRGNMNAKTLAGELKISVPTVTRYKRAERAPTVENLILIADYFKCSTDFLLGLEDTNRAGIFMKCPPFGERLKFLVEYFKLGNCGFYTKAKISESTFFEWKNGSGKPSLDGIIKIAQCFDCRVDFVLGREN